MRDHVTPPKLDLTRDVHTIDQMIQQYSATLVQQNYVVLLALTEIDQLSLKEFSTVLKALVRIRDTVRALDETNTFLPQIASRQNLLLITNKEDHTQILTTMLSVADVTFNVITFSPYDQQQLFDLVKQRAELGLRPEVYTPNLLRHIARLAEPHHDANLALNLLWQAGTEALREEADHISYAHTLSSYMSMTAFDELEVPEQVKQQQLE